MTTLLAAYSRREHLAWAEKTDPDALEWPPEPRDGAAAAAYISAYAGIGGLLDAILALGLGVEFAPAREGVIAIITEGDATALSTGIGDTLRDALEAAAAGLDGTA